MKQLFIILTTFFLLTACGGSSPSEPEAPVTSNQPEDDTNTFLPFPDAVVNTLPMEISAETAVAEMKIGINLGNTLDAPNEGEWALAAEQHHIQAFADAGFKHVRIPITWHQHIGQQAPYDIDPVFMQRVEQIVDWALELDLYVIINAHHDDWFKDDYNNVELRQRFDTIWFNISERFKNKSAKLMFEIFNEPHDITVTQLNEINKRTLAIIRNQTSNRLVVFSGTGWSSYHDLFNIDVPDTEDPYLIANYHSYDPWGFAGQCVDSWGTQTDIDALRAIYQDVSNWSTTNDMPVMVNEFGAAKYDHQNPENVCNQTERESYIRHHVKFANEFGIGASFWDDGGSFSTYDRANNTWGTEKDILVELQIGNE